MSIVPTAIVSTDRYTGESSGFDGLRAQCGEGDRLFYLSKLCTIGLRSDLVSDISQVYFGGLFSGFTDLNLPLFIFMEYRN